MADQAPSRAVLPAVAPEVTLVESNKATSGATAGRTVVLSEKKAMVNSTVASETLLVESTRRTFGAVVYNTAREGV